MKLISVCYLFIFALFMFVTGAAIWEHNLLAIVGWVNAVMYYILFMLEKYNKEK